MNQNLITNIENIAISDINNRAKKDFVEFVHTCEKEYDRRLWKLCDILISREDKKKILFIAGPSCSGKTTTANKIKSMLDQKISGNCIVSMDDFYIDRELAPLRADGSKNLEGYEAIDIAGLIKCIKELISVGKTRIPLFDFTVSKPSENYKEIDMGDTGVIIVEGLNALNPIVTDQFKNKEEVYLLEVGIFTNVSFMNNDGEVQISPVENRLARRIIRDMKFRATSPQKTFDIWKYVIDGEKEYIYPYIGEADMIIGTTMLYEPCLYAKYLAELIEQEKNPDIKQQLEDVYRVYEVFFVPDFEVVIPEDSIIREFLG